VLRDVVISGKKNRDIYVLDGFIREMGPSLKVPDSVEAVEGEGAVVFPGMIDSHVHLSYYPVADALSKTGVLGAVDLAAPVSAFDSLPETLSLLLAGPMVTAENGYPTQSWGSNGYGLEVSTVQQAGQAVRDLVALGARVIKIPLDGSSLLTDEMIADVVEVAHKEGLHVVAHALSEDSAQRGARLGCDALAHTPTLALTDETIDLWKERTVISTLRAFGGGEAARDNLARLHAAGAQILYGTDLGNSRTVGVDLLELGLLEEAGLTRAEVLASLTSGPAAYWDLNVGTLAVDRPAHFLVLSGDPASDLAVLGEPVQVYYGGRALLPGEL
jgi:imidazolonepropionase-like amidohydrolase